MKRKWLTVNIHFNHIIWRRVREIPFPPAYLSLGHGRMVDWVTVYLCAWGLFWTCPIHTQHIPGCFVCPCKETIGKSFIPRAIMLFNSAHYTRRWGLVCSCQHIYVVYISGSVLNLKNKHTKNTLIYYIFTIFCMCLLLIYCCFGQINQSCTSDQLLLSLTFGFWHCWQHGSLAPPVNKYSFKLHLLGSILKEFTAIHMRRIATDQWVDHLYHSLLWQSPSANFQPYIWKVERWEKQSPFSPASIEGAKLNSRGRCGKFCRQHAPGLPGGPWPCRTVCQKEVTRNIAEHLKNWPTTKTIKLFLNVFLTKVWRVSFK